MGITRALIGIGRLSPAVVSIGHVKTNKTALVTGANKGIGHAIARGLGSAGFTVAVGARDERRREDAVERLRADGIDAFGVALDVTSDDSVAAAAEVIERTVGKLDVLVNNAGISGDTASGKQIPSTLDLDVMQTVLETNVFGVVRVTNAMLPLLHRSDAPRIVNVSSNMGSLALQTGPQMDQTHAYRDCGCMSAPLPLRCVYVWHPHVIYARPRDRA